MAFLSDCRLYSDLSISQEDTRKKHKELLDDNRGTDAAKLLNNSNVDACTASLLNGWENKIYTMQKDIGTEKFRNPFIVKKTEPTNAEMSDCDVWLKTY